MKASEFRNAYKNAGFKITEDLGIKLQDDELRNGLYELIPLNEISSYHSLLKALFEQEVKYRNNELEDGAFAENIYYCAFFLFTIGDLNDVITMWRSERSNFDLGCGFDIQFLVGAGVEETINYLRQSKDVSASDALQYIEACKSAGDFDNRQEWINQKKAYFEINE